MQNMPPQTPGHHPYQMIRGHSHEQLYGHPHPGQPMYSPYYYRKWFYVYYLYPDLHSQTICWRGWDDNAYLRVRNNSIGAWPNFLVWSLPWYCIVLSIVDIDECSAVVGHSSSVFNNVRIVSPLLQTNKLNDSWPQWFMNNFMVIRILDSQCIHLIIIVSGFSVK